MKFFVKTLTGRTIVLEAESFHTTENLKTLIAERERISSDELQQLQLIFADRLLEDGISLADSSIQSRSTVRMVRMRGVGDGPPRFMDLENTWSLKTVPYFTPAMRWHLVPSGLNVEGICTNNRCVGYLELVICPKGFVTFNLTVDREDNYCPACGKTVRATACSFSDCVWMYEGRKAQTPAPSLSTAAPTLNPKPPSSSLDAIANSSTRRLNPDNILVAEAVEPEVVVARKKNAYIVSPWYTSKNRSEYGYEDFDDIDNVKEWESLVIIARERPSVGVYDIRNRPMGCVEASGSVSEAAAETSGSVVSVDHSCEICFGELEETENTSCAHTFHEECVNLWKCSWGGTRCPLCRAESLSFNRIDPRLYRSPELLLTLLLYASLYKPV